MRFPLLSASKTNRDLARFGIAFILAKRLGSPMWGTPLANAVLLTFEGHSGTANHMQQH